ALEDLLVCVEPGEGMPVIHFDLVLETRVLGRHPRQSLATPGEMIREQIAQGHELDAIRGGEAVLRRVCAPATAADEPHANRGGARGRWRARQSQSRRRRRRDRPETTP